MACGKNHETPKPYPETIARRSSPSPDLAAETRGTNTMSSRSLCDTCDWDVAAYGDGDGDNDMDPIIRVLNGDAIVFERTNRPRATTLKKKLSVEVKFCPEIELTKNIRRKVKRTKAILGNGEDHCGATARWNALAAGWGDKDVRTDEAMKGDGRRNLTFWSDQSEQKIVKTKENVLNPTEEFEKPGSPAIRRHPRPRLSPTLSSRYQHTHPRNSPERQPPQSGNLRRFFNEENEATTARRSEAGHTVPRWLPIPASRPKPQPRNHIYQ